MNSLIINNEDTIKIKKEKLIKYITTMFNVINNSNTEGRIIAMIELFTNINNYLDILVLNKEAKVNGFGIAVKDKCNEFKGYENNNIPELIVKDFKRTCVILEENIVNLLND